MCNKQIDKVFNVAAEDLEKRKAKYEREERIIKKLPLWFKEKYKVELSEYKEAGRYWIQIEDFFILIDEMIKDG